MGRAEIDDPAFHILKQGLADGELRGGSGVQDILEQDEQHQRWQVTSQIESGILNVR